MSLGEALPSGDSTCPEVTEELSSAIVGHPDFPKRGGLYFDVSGVLKDAVLHREVVRSMARPFLQSKITHVVGIEAMGFLLAGGVALSLNAGLLLVRKSGKLPEPAGQIEYETAYSSSSLTIPYYSELGSTIRILIVDDVLASGGTIEAVTGLMETLPAEVIGVSVLIEVPGYRARERMKGIRVESLICY